MDRQEEQDVIARVRRGERAAFAALVDAYRTPIFNLAFRMTGHPSDAEDLAQETFLRAFEQLPRFNPERSFYTWLFTISLNLIRNHLKKTGRRRRADHYLPRERLTGAVDSRGRPVVQQGTRDEEDVSAEKGEGLARCLRKLSPELRELLVLRFYQGLSFEVIAEIAGLSQSAVKMRVYRGLDKLRKCMEEM
jgi:RNA polymerase sigma-70 factor (ECF subfamily)